MGGTHLAGIEEDHPDNQAMPRGWPKLCPIASHFQHMALL